MMTNNDELGREWESILSDLIYNNSLSETEEDAVIDDEVEVETFERAGLLTRDNGIVVYMDGKEIQITIQAYSK